jgi:hypothetical protein
VTSGPIPSPGKRTMVFFIVVPEQKQIRDRPYGVDECRATRG